MFTYLLTFLEYELSTLLAQYAVPYVMVQMEDLQMITSVALVIIDYNYEIAFPTLLLHARAYYKPTRNYATL